MDSHQEQLTLPGLSRGLHDVTDRVAGVVCASGITSGLCHVFLRHTSASLLIQESADPDVCSDLADWFARAVPDGDARYRHTAEGPDDMSAHIRAALTQPSLTVPVVDGVLALGTWQALYLFEHRRSPRRRTLLVTIQGHR
ncbi:MAG TPA: YjbQ family protein [Deltaproteobacteria bacterium]|nr:YjbQ family protein [Deltaproteobacteria bacterium]